MEEIKASWKKLMEDASGASRYYMSEAADAIDAKFGKGYAKAHPELVGQYMKVAVYEYRSNCIAKVLYDIASEFQNNDAKSHK